MRASILCVVGTRPEAVKLAPVIIALQRHERLRPTILSTGQHRELLSEALDDFGLRADVDLALMQDAQTPVALLAAALPLLARVISTLKPSAVLIQGDTMTALAAAQASFLSMTPVVHVEAGLRTGVRSAPFPEESIRRQIAQLCDLHFAPTAAARTALLGEGIASRDILVTGNTVIDALHLIRSRLASSQQIRCQATSSLPALDPDRPLIVVTAHRRENHGAPLAAIAEAVARLAASGCELVLPLHPHPAVEGAFRARLEGVPHVHLIPPLRYSAFVALLEQAIAVLTDSGGVQEEAPALGVPALVMRDVTERSEGVLSGVARLVGTATEAIVDAVHELLDNPALHRRMAEPSLPYGDGVAAPRIVAALDRSFASARMSAELVH